MGFGARGLGSLGLGQVHLNKPRQNSQVMPRPHAEKNSFMKTIVLKQHRGTLIGVPLRRFNSFWGAKEVRLFREMLISLLSNGKSRFSMSRLALPCLGPCPLTSSTALDSGVCETYRVLRVGLTVSLGFGVYITEEGQPLGTLWIAALLGLGWSDSG